MGSDTGKVIVPGSGGSLSTILDPSEGGNNLAGMFDPGGSIFKELTGSDFANRLARKGPAQKVRAQAGDDPEAIAALKKAEKDAKKLVARQKQKEAARLAAAESEIGTRRALARPGGGSLLTATSARGVETLGGV